MSTTTDNVAHPTMGVASYTLLLLMFLALSALTAWMLWHELASGWSKPWTYADVFHDPNGPTAPLSPAENFGRNLVYGITLGLATVMSLGGAVYNLLRLLAARHRRHSAPGDA